MFSFDSVHEISTIAYCPVSFVTVGATKTTIYLGALTHLRLLVNHFVIFLMAGTLTIYH
jgi:hypothetical protein